MIMLAFVALLALAACGGSRSAADNDAATAREDTRVVVVTHGQSSDPFWSVVSNGVRDAADDLGVRVEYQAPTSFDMVRMSQLIDAAVASRPSALVVSVPDPAALSGSIRAAVDAGIPTLGINAGADDWQRLGLIGYLGQTEYEAGLAAGDKLAEAGARNVLCVNHEVGNISQDERCRGLDDAVRRAGGTTNVLAVDLANPDDARQRVAGALSRDASIDGVLTLGPAGAAPTLAALRSLRGHEAVPPAEERHGAGSDLEGPGGGEQAAGPIHFGTFDLDPEVLNAIADGEMLFAVDQQPYLQGYLAVVLVTKYIETRTMPGGGELVRTGPSFVTRENAADVIRLTEQGVR